MIIIDCEIKRAIPPRKGEPPLPDGIETCEGWRDFAGMGVSVVCTYDIATHLSRCFLEEDFAELVTYLDGKPTAGFNTRRFDLPLLGHHGVTCQNPSDHYDMLEMIWVALGLNPNKFYFKTHGGWSLDSVCQATLGIAKTGHGALAPVWWQQGKRGKVIDYCLNDVWMEGQLLMHILRGQPVRNQAGHVVRVEPPAGVRYTYEADPITRPRAERVAQLNKEITEHLAEDAPAGTMEGLQDAIDEGRDVRVTANPPVAESVTLVTTAGLGIIR